MKSTMPATQRREFLELALGGAMAAASVRAGVRPAAAEPLAQPVPFAPDTALKAAVQLASKPVQGARARPCPAVFSNLNFEQYASIRRVPGTAIWANDKVGFSLEPLHRGFVYTTPIVINIVENGFSQKVIYDPADFDFGKLQPPATMGDLGFPVAHPQGVGRGLPGRGDLSGRELLSLARARAELRRHRARPGDPYGGRAG